MPLELPAQPSYAETDPGPPGVARAENPAEIKSGWGGRRPGAGRPRKPQPPAYADTALAWRVFATHAQAERWATQELTRQGYDAYLPLIAIRRRDPVIASQWHEVRVPLYAGYGFIRLTDRESREPILAVRGIRELLHRADGRLYRVTDAEITRLRDGDADRLKLPKERGSVLEPEQVVRIVDGPFLGHPGRVAACDGVRTQVEVMVFGRPTLMWLDRAAVAG